MEEFLRVLRYIASFIVICFMLYWIFRVGYETGYEDARQEYLRRALPDNVQTI